MKSARKVPAPYEVKYLDHTFFKDFAEVGTLKSIRPGRRTGDPTVTDMRCLKYTPDAAVEYKLNYSDDWQPLLQPRSAAAAVNHQPPSPLYTTSRPIKEIKYQHLQQLKAVIPTDYHRFYDELRH